MGRSEDDVTHLIVNVLGVGNSAKCMFVKHRLHCHVQTIEGEQDGCRMERGTCRGHTRPCDCGGSLTLAFPDTQRRSALLSDRNHQNLVDAAGLAHPASDGVCDIVALLCDWRIEPSHTLALHSRSGVLSSSAYHDNTQWA